MGEEKDKKREKKRRSKEEKEERKKRKEERKLRKVRKLNEFSTAGVCYKRNQLHKRQPLFFDIVGDFPKFWTYFFVLPGKSCNLQFLIIFLSKF